MPAVPTTFGQDEDIVPASEELVSLFEMQNGVSLPTDYRDFLLRVNGGAPDRDMCDWGENGDFAATFFGIHQGAEWKRLDFAISSFGHDLSQFLPIAESNGGNYFVLKLHPPDQGAVYHWDHELEDVQPVTFKHLTLVAPSFDAFLVGLKRVPELANPYE